MAKGGRGGQRGAGWVSGVGGLGGMINQFNNAPIHKGDYDADGRLTGWQIAATDDYDGHILRVIENTDVSQYNDGYQIYDSPYQRFVLSYDLNMKPYAVLDQADFDRYVNATSQTVLYRGASSVEANKRLYESELFHTGRGVMGDGVYASSVKSDTDIYGANKIQMALSPKARVIDLNSVRRSMPSNASYKSGGTKLGRALYKAGSGGTGGYRNIGEAQWALKNGYNVIQSGSYHVILTRDAIVVKKPR